MIPTHQSPQYVWLGVFSHPDDETSASGGTMPQLIKDGHIVQVVTATRGELGTLGTGDIRISRDQLPYVREAELRKNMELIGAPPPIMLGYKDQNLNKEDPEIVSTELFNIMSDINTDIVVSFGPSGISGHTDHIATHQCTVEAFTRYKKTQTEKSPLLLYPTIPPDIAHQYNLTLSAEEKAIDIAISIKSTLHLKIKSLLNYESQEDAQEFAHRLKQTPDPFEYFTVSSHSTSDWAKLDVISYLLSIGESHRVFLPE